MTIGRCSRLALLIGCSIACAALGGCVVDGPSKPEPAKPRPMPREATHPVKMIVSPLSRVGVESVGGPSIQLHLEFRDSQERSTKAYGLLRVDLYKPAAAPDGSGPSPTQPKDQTWEIDLTDPLKNSLTFDEMITRTYTITLTKVPEWLLEWSAHRGPAMTGAPTVVVQFLQPGMASDKALRAVYALTR